MQVTVIQWIMEVNDWVRLLKNQSGLMIQSHFIEDSEISGAG
jgi:hypothetical protein